MLPAPVRALGRLILRRWLRVPRLRDQLWAIGLYSGTTLDSLAPHPEALNPVLCAGDIIDVDAAFVADPFLLQSEGEYLMFFEVMNRADGKGDIGLARSSDGIDWRYTGIILDAPFHLSYPYAFTWEGETYLLPEALESAAVTLYAAETFPARWSARHTLLSGKYVDPSIARIGSMWWLFAGEPGNRTLRLFSAARLSGPFREHPASPIVAGNPCAARPAGRVFTLGKRIIRCAQVAYPRYGTAVRLFEITTLTPDVYAERPLGTVLEGSGRGWNAAGMHHLDALRLADGTFLAAVDGWYAARCRPRWRAQKGMPHA